jgi:phytoene dehydrogenase-like protein
MVRLLGQRIRLARARAPELLRQPDMTTEAALRERGFSERIIEGFFRPFVGGIQLDTSLQTSRRMFDVVLQSLLTGDAAVPARGMGAISAQLAASLPDDHVRLNARVTDVARHTVTVDASHRIRADRVVVATDGPSAATLLGLPRVESNPATCVWFSAGSAPIDDRYLVVDGTGHGPARNIAVMTNVAPEYAPPGTALIAAACPGVDDPDAEQEVRRQLAVIWGSQVATWSHLRTDAIAHGQPRQHPPFSPKQRVDLGDGLFVCGDHRDTASIQGALFSGRRCGEAVLASLT